MQLSIGPYVILGRLHVPPGQDPMRNVLQREPMIPFTGVTMAYNVAGTVVARDVGTVIVNRHLVEWITEHRRGRGPVPGGDDPLALLDEPAQGLHGALDALVVPRRRRRRSAGSGGTRGPASIENRSSSAPAGAPAMRDTT